MTTRNAGELALALQSARGTPAAASTQRTVLVGGELNPAFSLGPNPEVRSTRISGVPWIPAAGLGGEAALIFRPKIAGLLLYAALGAKSVSGASDPFTHVFTLGGVLPWLTAWRHFGGIEDDRFSDVRISKLVIVSQAGQPVQMRVTLVGGQGAFRTAQETTVAVESADPFFARHGASALLVEGASFSSIREWTLTIEPGVSIEGAISGPVARMNGLAKISLDMLHVIADASLWRRMIYGSASPANLAAQATSPLTLAGSPVGVQFTLTAQASPARSLVIAIPQVALGPMGGFAPEVAYGPVIVRTSLQAYAPASGSPLTATLKNSQASY